MKVHSKNCKIRKLKLKYITFNILNKLPLWKQPGILKLVKMQMFLKGTSYLNYTMKIYKVNNKHKNFIFDGTNFRGSNCYVYITIYEIIYTLHGNYY